MYIIAFVTLVPRLLFDLESLCDFSEWINFGAYRNGEYILSKLLRNDNQIIILNAKVLNRITWQEIILFTVESVKHFRTFNPEIQNCAPYIDSVFFEENHLGGAVYPLQIII